MSWFEAMRWLLAFALVVGCEAPTSAPDAYVPTERGPLGMNDVTILLPLPPTLATPTLAAIVDDGGLVPRSLFDRLTAPGDVGATYEQFHLVAVRIDLCDRIEPTACPAGEDGRLRLVFQPLFVATSNPQAADVALHAFYPIPAAELPGVIDELRALAALGGGDARAPLAVSTAIANPSYASTLRALVARYAVSERLVRLTLFAQNIMAAAFVWAFRGLELRGGTYVDIVIPTVSASEQRVVLSGTDSYTLTPAADVPSGFALALDGSAFGTATSDLRAGALAALSSALSPTEHTADTQQCAGCHLATFLLARRAAVAGVTPASIPGRFTSTYDLTISDGVATTEPRSLRALGWFSTSPAISQRVINDTAKVLEEIEVRFPPAAP